MSDCTEGAVFVRRLGPAFTLKSLVALTLVSLCAALAPERALQSVLAALTIGAILTLNHRPGRYLGV